MLLGVFADWGAYLATTDHGRTCYATSKAKNSSAYAMVTSDPDKTIENEISFIFGSAVDANSLSTVTIDQLQLPLFAQGGGAWLKDALSEETMAIEAMRSGSGMLVTATEQGASMVDTYSLRGFGQALDRAAQECR